MLTHWQQISGSVGSTQIRAVTDESCNSSAENECAGVHVSSSNVPNKDSSPLSRTALFPIIAVVFIIGCGGSTEAAKPPQSISNDPDAPAELHVYNWSEFFPDELYDLFEAETGIQVRFSYYNEEEQMYADVIGEPGVYDIVVPSLSLADDMFAARVLRPLDLDLVPNTEHLLPRFAQLFEVTGSCAPFDWGTTGIAVNTAYIEDDITSWSDLWNPEYAGRASMVNNSGEVIGAALRYLGYSINTDDPEELAEAEALLVQHKPLLAGFLGSDVYWHSLESGDGFLWIAQAWSGDAVAIAMENPDIEYVVPREGTDMFVECLAITRDAPNPESAHAFINFVLRPDINALLNNYTGYASTNETSIETGLIDEELLTNPAVYPDPELLEAWDQHGVENTELRNKIWANLQD